MRATGNGAAEKIDSISRAPQTIGPLNNPLLSGASSSKNKTHAHIWKWEMWKDVYGRRGHSSSSCCLLYHDETERTATHLLAGFSLGGPVLVLARISVTEPPPRKLIRSPGQRKPEKSRVVTGNIHTRTDARTHIQTGVGCVLIPPNSCFFLRLRIQHGINILIGVGLAEHPNP